MDQTVDQIGLGVDNGNEYDRPPPYSQQQAADSPTAPNSANPPSTPASPASPTSPSSPGMPPRALQSAPTTQRLIFSKFNVRRWIRKREEISEDYINITRANSDAATAAIDAVISAAVNAANGESGSPDSLSPTAKKAAKAVQKSIVSVIEAVLEMPTQIKSHQKKALDMFLGALAQLSKERAANLAGGMWCVRAHTVSNCTAVALFKQLELDFSKHFRVKFRTRKMVDCFNEFMRPFWHVPDASAPAIADALNDAFACVVRGIADTHCDRKKRVAENYSKYAEYVIIRICGWDEGQREALKREGAFE